MFLVKYLSDFKIIIVLVTFTYFFFVLGNTVIFRNIQLYFAFPKVEKESIYVLSVCNSLTLA